MATPVVTEPQAGGNGNGQTTSQRDPLARGLGIVALIAFLAFVGALFYRISVPELQWSRLIYVFGAVEALAFAAAGYFFGREVHRERADEAKKDAKVAKDKAKTLEAKQAPLETQNERVKQAYLSMQSVIDKKRALRASDLAGPTTRIRALDVQAGVGTEAIEEAIRARLGGGAGESDWDEVADLAREFAEAAGIPQR